jgi:hypothetical protein
MAHDPAGHQRVQIINPLGQGRPAELQRVVDVEKSISFKRYRAQPLPGRPPA